MINNTLIFNPGESAGMLKGKNAIESIQLLKKFNALSYFEISSHSINRINSVSRSHPFLEIYSIFDLANNISFLS